MPEDIRDPNKPAYPSLPDYLKEKYEDASTRDQGERMMLEGQRHAAGMANPQVAVNSRRDLVQQEIKDYLGLGRPTPVKQVEQIKGYSTVDGAPAFKHTELGVGGYGEDGQFQPMKVTRDLKAKGGGGGKGVGALSQKDQKFNMAKEKHGRLSDSVIDTVSKLDTVTTLLTEMQEIQANVSTGRYMDAGSQLVQKIVPWGENLLSDDRLRLEQISSSLGAQIRKELSGTAVSEAELEELVKFLPNTKMGEAAFRLAVQGKIHEMRLIKNGLLKGHKAGGKDVSAYEDTPAASEATDKPSKDKPKPLNAKQLERLKELQADPETSDADKARIQAKLDAYGVGQ